MTIWRSYDTEFKEYDVSWNDFKSKKYLNTSWKLLNDNSLTTSWKILNDVNFYVHYGTELDSPLRKIIVKNIEFLYNIDVISFDRKSKNIEFIKNLM